MVSPGVRTIPEKFSFSMMASHWPCGIHLMLPYKVMYLVQCSAVLSKPLKFFWIADPNTQVILRNYESETMHSFRAYSKKSVPLSLTTGWPTNWQGCKYLVRSLHFSSSLVLLLLLPTLTNKTKVWKHVLHGRSRLLDKGDLKIGD